MDVLFNPSQKNTDTDNSHGSIGNSEDDQSVEPGEPGEIAESWGHKIASGSGYAGNISREDDAPAVKKTVNNRNISVSGAEQTSEGANTQVHGENMPEHSQCIRHESNIRFNAAKQPNDQIFWKFLGLTGMDEGAVLDETRKNELVKLIKFKRSYTSNGRDTNADNFFDFLSLTIRVVNSKKMGDDRIYQENPVLIHMVPRGMTLVFDADGNYIHAMIGPRKFSGKDPRFDEDLLENQVPSSCYDHDKTRQWAQKNLCSIVVSEKANGKFAILKIRHHNDRLLITAGSKNVHVTAYYEDIENIIKSHSSDIVRKIFSDIARNREHLEKLLPTFNEGYTLVGELEDGQHFVKGDDTISWFGLFRQGVPKENGATMAQLQALGHKTVTYQRCFKPGDSLETLEGIFQAQKCLPDEGRVLYIRHTETGETQLVKSKSIQYIVKRFAREKLKNGWSHIEAIKQRFVDAADYHQLNTDAAVRITAQLFAFAKWMMKKEYPCWALDCHLAEEQRPSKLLPFTNGFNNYWMAYLQEENAREIMITPGDLQGTFDKKAYLEAPQLTLYPKRLPGQEAKVVFFQDIQGGGKSTVASHLQKLLNTQSNRSPADSPRKPCQIIEQDKCWGDTKAAQGILHHALKDGRGPDFIIISRCNANLNHYSRYLNTAHDSFSRVLFVGNNQTNTVLGLAVALAGIVNRSDRSDSLMVGRNEHPFEEALPFIIENLANFEYHEKCKRVKTFNYNQRLEREAQLAFGTAICRFIDDGKKEPGKKKLNLNKETVANVKDFITQNKNQLMQLRLKPEAIAQKVYEFITTDRTPDDHDYVIPCLTTANYVGLFVQDKDPLTEIVEQHCQGPDGETLCHHLTQVYIGRNTKKVNVNKKLNSEFELEKDVVSHGIKCQVTVDALVVDKSGAAAFRVTQVVSTEGKSVPIASGKPHITAFLPPGCKAGDSVNFVHSEGENVNVITLEKPLIISTVCKWVS